MEQRSDWFTRHFRYERKLFVRDLSRREIEALINLHPAVFSAIYYERRVNNIYLDSFDMKSYFDNMSGAEKRVKVRVRWYGETLGAAERPVLELKIKEGPMCIKASFQLMGFRMDNDFSIDVLRDIFKASDMPGALKLDLAGLDFSLLNSYKRKYYLSADKKFRLTLDSELGFYGITHFRNSFLDRSVDHLNNIVEIKYAKEHNDDAHRVTGFFPFRVTKSSKYTIGLERLNMTKAYSHA
ncbi:MAG: VTC domain-containing protein [Candidatus Omnitrophota bacterium]